MSQLRYNEKRAKSRLNKALNHITFLKRSGHSFEDKVILETGTGATGIDPLLFSLWGANKVYTFDIIPQLTLEKFKITAKAVLEASAVIARLLAVPENDVSTTAKRILASDDLDEALEAGRIERYIAPNADPFQSSWDPCDIDVFYSESNLQRIPRDSLLTMVDGLSDLMRDGALMLHQIDCSDIVAQKDFRTVDRDLHPLYYLIFSEEQWALMEPREQGTQNRLREFEFLDLFKAAGFNPLIVESYVVHDHIRDVKDFVGGRPDSDECRDIAVVRSRCLCEKSTQSKGSRRVYELKNKNYGTPERSFNEKFGICGHRAEIISISDRPLPV